MYSCITFFSSSALRQINKFKRPVFKPCKRRVRAMHVFFPPRTCSYSEGNGNKLHLNNNHQREKKRVTGQTFREIRTLLCAAHEAVFILLRRRKWYLMMGFLLVIKQNNIISMYITVYIIILCTQQWIGKKYEFVVAPFVFSPNTRVRIKFI